MKRPGVSIKEHTPDENPEGSLSTLNGVTIPTCLSMFRYFFIDFLDKKPLLYFLVEILMRVTS